jgi:hypothetical protein
VTTGWVPRAVPAVPFEGCVVKTSLLAAPTTSEGVPKFVVPVTPLIVEVPLRVMFLLASRLPAVGRTAMLPNVMLLAALDAVLTVYVMADVVTEVNTIAMLPLLTVTVGFTEVRNSNPAGTFRMIVPVPISPAAASARVGPVRVINVPFPPWADMISA